MGFNAKMYEERSGLTPGLVGIGVIIAVDDGVTRQFLSETAQKCWQGDLDNPSIQLKIEIMHNKVSYQLHQLFSYRMEGNKTVFASNSNLKKYLKRYTKLPEVGDQVQLMTNADGFWRLVIE